MSQEIEKMLKQVEELEQKQDYKQLAEVYRKIATHYHKLKDNENERKYLEKAKEAKNLVQIQGKNTDLVDEAKSNVVLNEIDPLERYELLKKNRDLQPEKGIAYFELAEMATNLELYDEARMWFEDLLHFDDEETKNNLPAIYCEYANLWSCDYFKEYDLAKEYYEIAININNNYPEAYNNLAILLQSDYFREYDLAKKNFEKAISINSKYSDAYHNLAILLHSDYFKEYDLAKEYYKKAIKIKNDYFKACNNLAILLHNDYFKEYDLAREYYEKAIRINNKYSDAYYNLAILLHNDYFKEYDLAKEYYEKAIQIAPSVSDFHNNLGAILANEHFKQYISAKENYERAILLNPNNSNAHHNIASLCFEHLKENEKAQYHFAKAIEINENLQLSRNVMALTIEKIPFITKIEIQKIRHLSGFNIDIDESEAKHLLLTGTNGSGKTTVLNECRKFLQKILDTPVDELFTDKSRDEIFFPKNYTLKLIFNSEKLTDVRLAYESGRFVVKYLGANTGENGNRALNPRGVDTIEKVQLPEVKKIEDNLADKIVAYLVDLDYRRLRAFRNDEKEVYTEIDNWFDGFLKALQQFDEHIVDLKYSDIEKTHNFIIKVKNPINRSEIIDVKFDELPDGFKAVFKIVFEIILQIVLQIKTKVHTTYDVPGIVLIDEPELFLHINMQKKILPALTSLFPNIQFIVATHSPFVLNSISNAVIYDLEKQIRLVDVSDIPANKLNDYYFSFSPEYVESIKTKVDEFAELIVLYNEKKLDKPSKKRLAELDIELDEVTPYISDEYFKKFKDNQKYLYE